MRVKLKSERLMFRNRFLIRVYEQLEERRPRSGRYYVIHDADAMSPFDKGGSPVVYIGPDWSAANTWMRGQLTPEARKIMKRGKD